MATAGHRGDCVPPPSLQRRSSCQTDSSLWDGHRSPRSRRAAARREGVPPGSGGGMSLQVDLGLASLLA